MPYFLIELWSTEKSCTKPFKEILLCSSFVKSFYTLPKQKLYHLVLSFTLNLQISSNSHHHGNENLKKFY